MSESSQLLLSSAELLAAQSIAIDPKAIGEDALKIIAAGWESLKAQGLAGGSPKEPTMSPLLSQAVSTLYASPMLAILVCTPSNGGPVAFSIHLGSSPCSAVHNVDDDGNHHILLLEPDAGFEIAKTILSAENEKVFVSVSVRRESGLFTDSFLVVSAAGRRRIFDSVQDFESGRDVADVDNSAVWSRFGRCLEPISTAPID